MLKRSLGALLTLVVAAGAVSAVPESRSDLTVHEWGTFTSVAGVDGRAVAWRPLAEPSDLPCFVERAALPPKFSFATTVRMETPVIYFYAGQALTVDVTVDFRQGLMTEFFPRAASHPNRLEWRNVQVQPGSATHFAQEPGPSHYYAARAAQAAPLEVDGQREGFLFYRGVGGFPLPLTAVTTVAGGIEIANEGPDPLPVVMLFERRDGRIGYRLDSSVSNQTTMPAPTLDSDLPGVRRALVRMLIGKGLYPREAEAMVATWSDSWFEEGTRLFYLVPRRIVDRTLPLDVRPRPANVARVFVGRLEIAAPSTLSRLKKALLQNDTETIAGFGRFLEPFGQRILSGELPLRERRRIEAALLDAGARSHANKPCSSSTTDTRP